MLIVPKVAAIGHHAAHADGELEEGQPHGRQHHAGGDLGKIRGEQEIQPLARPGQGQTANADHQQQDEEHRHQPLGDGLYPLRHPHQQYASHQRQHQPLPQQALQGIRDERIEGRPRDGGIGREDLAAGRLEDVGKHPGRHFGVKRHDEEGRRHPHGRDQPPGLPLGRQLDEPAHRVGFCLTAQHDLRDHHRQPHQQGGDDIDQQKTGAPVFPGQIGKFPDVAKADRRAQGRGKHAEGAGKTISGFGKGIAHACLALWIRGLKLKGRNFPGINPACQGDLVEIAT
ncbi:hypothetical protein D3C80_1075490 [compost metagenome]